MSRMKRLRPKTSVVMDKVPERYKHIKRYLVDVGEVLEVTEIMGALVYVVRMFDGEAIFFEGELRPVGRKLKH